MNHPTKKSYVITPLKGYGMEAGRWLWALEDTRRRTLQAVKDVAPDAIDWIPPHGDNSIGTLLYHIAAIEADWLYMEVLEEEQFPPEVASLLPYDVRNSEGRLTPIQGIGIEEHLRRLASIRAYLLDVFERIDDEDFYLERNFEQYDVTPEWVVYHLIRHEAEHQGQIVQLRKSAERALLS